MKKDKRKEVINHFIKFFIYDLKKDKDEIINSEIYIASLEDDLNRFIKPYIEDEHYNFSPFTEIKEKK